MIYSFRCDGCANDVEIDRPMKNAGDPAYCAICTAPMRRIFNSAFHCDEIRGTTYVHPKTAKTVKDHGKCFDIGGGFWYKTKKERREKIKAKGLNEIGPSMV